MSEEINLDEDASRELSHLLSRYYRSPRLETREVKKTEEVEKEVVEENTVEEEIVEDAGPHPGSYAVLALGIVGGGLGIAADLVYVGAGAGLLGLAIGASLVFFWRRKEKKTVTRTEEKPKTVAEEVERTETVEEEVPSTKRVVSASRGALSFDAIDTPVGLVVHGPGSLNETRHLSFPTIGSPNAVYDRTEEVDGEVVDIPWVLDGEASVYETTEETNYDGSVPLRGEERTLQEYFQNIDAVFGDLETPDLSITALEVPHLFSELAPQMEQASSNTEANPELRNRLNGPGGTKLDRFAREWESRWTRVNLALLQARSKSLFDEVGPECYDLGSQLSYGAFNFYCPFCNEEEQEQLLDRDYSVHSSSDYEPIQYSSNTRCTFRPDSRTWRCKICERETQNPIPMHRMLDEVLLPAYDQLMQENKNERLRIYSKARDKERELRERAQSEIDKMRHEHMNEMFALSEEMERLQADVRGEREAIRSMEDIVASFRASQEGTREGIVEFAEQSLRAAEERKKNVEHSVDSFKEEMKEEMSKNVMEYSKTERKEQLKRDQLQKQMAQGIKNIEENTQEMKEDMKDMKEGIGDLEEEMKKQRANERARDRERGRNPDDESRWTNPVSKTMKDMERNLRKGLGQSSREAEKAVMDK